MPIIILKTLKHNNFTCKRHQTLVLEVYQLQCTGLDTEVNSDFINTLLMVLLLCCSFLYQASLQMLDQYAMPQVYDQTMACIKTQGSEMLILRVPCTFASDYVKSILGNI